MTMSKTLSQLLDDAVDASPFFRRMAYKWKLRNASFRDKVLIDLRVKLHDDPEVQEMGISTILASDAFNANAVIQIDLDKLEKLIQLIIKYLPEIIKLIGILFPASIAFLCLALSPGIADAQILRRGVVRQQTYSSCPGGVCPTRSVQSSTYIPSKAPYSPRWKNYDGLSFDEHARTAHGIHTQGMTYEQIARLRDHDHDTYGPGHPAILHRLSNRTVVLPVVPTRTAKKPTSVKSVPIEALTKVSW